MTKNGNHDNEACETNRSTNGHHARRANFACGSRRRRKDHAAVQVQNRRSRSAHLVPTLLFQTCALLPSRDHNLRESKATGVKFPYYTRSGSCIMIHILHIRKIALQWQRYRLSGSIRRKCNTRISDLVCGMSAARCSFSTCKCLWFCLCYVCCIKKGVSPALLHCRSVSVPCGNTTTSGRMYASPLLLFPFALKNLPNLWLESWQTSSQFFFYWQRHLDLTALPCPRL